MCTHSLSFKCTHTHTHVIEFNLMMSFQHVLQNDDFTYLFNCYQRQSETIFGTIPFRLLEKLFTCTHMCAYIFLCPSIQFFHHIILNRFLWIIFSFMFFYFLLLFLWCCCCCCCDHLKKYSNIHWKSIETDLTNNNKNIFNEYFCVK